MISGAPAAGLTVVFVVTGSYCLWRLITTWSRHRTDRAVGETTADLNHVIMSAAMIAMIWIPAGTVGTWVQVGVFSVFAAAFGVRVATSTGSTMRLDALAHLLLDGAMAWMLAAMPLLMGGAPSAGGMDMPGMHHGGGATPTTGPAPGWALTVNAAAVVIAGLVAGWWVVRLARSTAHRLHGACHALMGAGMAAMLIVMAAA